MTIDCQAILWDVGGTLVEIACSLPELVRHRLASCGIEHSRLSDLHIERSYADFIRNEQQWQSSQTSRLPCRSFWIITD
jgi:hypothetical protein